VIDRFKGLDGYSVENKRISGLCPHCDNHATLWVLQHEEVAGPTSDGDGKVTVRLLLRLRCDWCREASLFLQHAAREAHAAKSGGGSKYYYLTITLDQLWPKVTPRELPPEAPAVAREVFAEAALAEAAGAFRLAGIGYRATVEQIVKEQGASGRNLYERITALASNGVPQGVVDAFHEARMVGNDAAHDALAYSGEELADVADLIEETVLVLYVQPAQRAAMAQKRAARRAAAKNTTP
jgi:ribosomal protein L44E